MVDPMDTIKNHGDTSWTRPETARVLLDSAGSIHGPRDTGYDTYEFQVGPDTVEVTAFLSYTGAPLFLHVYGPNGYRGTVMKPSATGHVTLTARCSAFSASPGIVAGSLEPGTWTLLLDHGPDLEYAAYTLVVTERRGTPGAHVERALPGPHAVSGTAGWYRGELHTHSEESDGACSPADVARAAEAKGLDFVSLTDHCTISGWYPMRETLSGSTLLIRGCEITGRRGHANLHGINTPIDPAADRPERGLNEIAEDVHAQGGIFCVNHAFSAVLGWRADDFEWDRADAMEVIHALDRPGNNLLLGLWDHHLKCGRRRGMENRRLAGLPESGGGY